jgi:hypothetical protein
LSSWPAREVVRKEGFREQGRRVVLAMELASGQDAMTRTEMLETMKRLDAHANALLLTGASDIDLLGGMFDVMPDFKALLDAGYGGETTRTQVASPVCIATPSCSPMSPRGSRKVPSGCRADALFRWQGM